MGLLEAPKVPDAYTSGVPSTRIQSMRKECDVKSDLYTTAITRAHPMASRVAPIAEPSAPARSAKPMFERFGMTATAANVWPLSPQDWSTG